MDGWSSDNGAAVLPPDIAAPPYAPPYDGTDGFPVELVCAVTGDRADALVWCPCVSCTASRERGT